MKVVPAGAPFVKRGAGEFHGIGSAACAPVKIPVDDVVLIRPIAAQQIAGIEVDDVVRENEGDVRLGPGAHQLVPFAEREDVVAQNIFATVMLMKARALAAINDVALQDNSAAAFVGVEAPAAISEGVHVVDEVVANDRPRLRAECVDRAHVAQPKLADVVQMVVLDQVGPARRFAITPRPADGDGGVVKVMNVIVRDAISAALQNDNAHGWSIDLPEMMHMIIDDGVSKILINWVA